MKKIIILKDSASTYEIIYLEDKREIKRIGGLFEHDITKYIRNYLDDRVTIQSNK